MFSLFERDLSLIHTHTPFIPSIHLDSVWIWDVERFEQRLKRLHLEYKSQKGFKKKKKNLSGNPHSSPNLLCEGTHPTGSSIPDFLEWEICRFSEVLAPLPEIGVYCGYLIVAHASERNAVGILSRSSCQGKVIEAQEIQWQVRRNYNESMAFRPLIHDRKYVSLRGNDYPKVWIPVLDPSSPRSSPEHKPFKHPGSAMFSASKQPYSVPFSGLFNGV